MLIFSRCVLHAQFYPHCVPGRCVRARETVVCFRFLATAENKSAQQKKNYADESANHEAAIFVVHTFPFVFKSLTGRHAALSLDLNRVVDGGFVLIDVGLV